MNTQNIYSKTRRIEREPMYNLERELKIRGFSPKTIKAYLYYNRDFLQKANKGGYIEMRDNREISREQFAEKRKEAGKNKNYYLSLTNKTNKEKNSFENKLNETFSIVTNVKKRFNKNKENGRKKYFWS